MVYNVFVKIRISSFAIKHIIFFKYPKAGNTIFCIIENTASIQGDPYHTNDTDGSTMLKKNY